MSRHKMYTLYILVFVLLIHQTSSSKAEASLYKVLLQNYSSLVRPVRNPNKILKVSMKIFLQQITNVDEQNQVVEVNAWLKYQIWNDYRLRWSPIMYDNISSVRFIGRENQIWQPDILLYNRPVGYVQICFLKFGSWTYHGFSLDLRIDSDEQSPSADLSTYISNGEWLLISAPAKRDVTFYKCCPEPYPTIKFYLHLRRRSLYYTFNIIIPSLLISIMTLLTFCLPAHDMSEKIGFLSELLYNVM
uniref:Neur_chan_LBD domain-containing protein n=1 Tax=Heterorhabditis bacteriophora TaxID=37862 RepID=A0A1I7WTQ9_HETBA